MGRPGIICREIDLDLLLGGHDDYVLHDAGRCFAGEPGEFERMPVQVNWVSLITFDYRNEGGIDNWHSLKWDRSWGSGFLNKGLYDAVQAE